MNTAAAEPIRLVIWDLDETFWHGTLTEGGITYRRDLHDMVVTLARRGIISAICSKNDPAPVQEILEREGLWEYFVFSSINWQPKGPRLAALIEAIQLRAPTVLFIDDNPHNLAEAQHYAPGIQIGGPEILADLLDHPLCRGKDDQGLTRLAQYRLLAQRQADAAQSGDATAFLRESGIRVEIHVDVLAHADRAIELINRTNQLNFTKQRLPEHPAAARRALEQMLGHVSNHAGLIRVHDRYGDYGFCGLFVLRHDRNAEKTLLQFCFSCRILNMGVETWLYQRLGRPRLDVVGDVLSDPAATTTLVDWIEVDQLGGSNNTQIDRPRSLDIVYARGACHVRPMSHYFGMVAGEVVEEFDTARDGRTMPLNHTMFAHYAIHGMSGATRAVMHRLGYRDEDFSSFITHPPHGRRMVWVLNFWTEAGANLYRHRGTGALIPIAFNPAAAQQMRQKLGADATDIRKWDDTAPGVDADIVAFLRDEFDFVGNTPDELLTRNITDMLACAPADTLVIVLLANDQRLKGDGTTVAAPWVQRINDLARSAAAPFANARLLDVRECLQSNADLVVDQPLKFQRAVFFRLYEAIMRCCEAVGQ